jgi:hypothetical protein
MNNLSADRCSGDVVVMYGPSRLCYHAVPRILDDIPQDLLLPGSPTCQATAASCYSNSSLTATSATGSDTDAPILAVTDSAAECLCEAHWRPFAEFLSVARININVRQVLFPGQSWP